MSLLDQNLDPDRYLIVPRTLIFLRYRDQVLVIRKSDPDHPWSGKFNAIGGHIEPGEDLFSAAKREILEETGLEPVSLRLCGTVLIDVRENPGIGLFVLMAETYNNEIRSSSEGDLLWVSSSELDSHPVLEDLPALLNECLRCYSDRTFFSWSYRFDEERRLSISKSETS